MKTIGVGVIGCGKAAQALHLPSLSQLPGKFRLDLVCDASAAVARRVAERWAVGHWTNDMAELLARRGVEAVLVANPNRFHASTAASALAAGKHVLLEKPAAMSTADSTSSSPRSARRPASCRSDTCAGSRRGFVLRRRGSPTSARSGSFGCMT